MSTPSKPKGKGGMTWDAVAEASLFKCVLTRHAPTKVDYQGLEKDMRELGYDCTAKAITHRIQKMKTTANSVNPSSGNDSDPATTPTTPSKPATAGKKSTTTTNGAKKPRASPTKKEAANGKGKGAAKGAAAKGKANKRKLEEMEEQEEEEGEEAGSDVTEPEEKKMKVEEEGEEEV
ncbi:MAG: hypothetical protein Q9213_007585 [Squamulea squamosa]